MTVLDPMHRLRTALESPMRPAPHRLTLVSAKDGSCMHTSTGLEYVSYFTGTRYSTIMVASSRSSKSRGSRSTVAGL